MNVEPIKSEQDYDQALERLNEILGADAGAKQG